MKIERKSFFLRYGATILSVAAGLLARSILNPLLGADVPFITMFPAVAFAALYGGLGAGLLATVLGAFAANFFVVPPYFSLSLSAKETSQIVVFLAMGSFISWVVSERGRFQMRLKEVETESERQKREDEAALRQIEEKSRLTQKTVGVGIWEWNLKTGEVDWSEGIYDLFGIEKGEQANLKNWLDLAHAEDRERMRADIQNLIAANENEFYLEFRTSRPSDGETRWLASQGQIIRGDGESADRLFGVKYDITRRKQHELEIKNLNQELNRRIQEMQTIFDIAPVGIAVAQDADCDVISANPALAEMLGIAPGDNISVNAANAGRVPYKHLRNGREMTPAELPMQRAVAEKRTVQGAETDILRADGKLITIYAYAAPVFDHEGEVVSCIAAHIDVTERKKQELERERRFDIEQSLRLQAEEANRLKDEFLATVSHELRTPLNSIIGWITMFRQGRLPEDAKDRALEAIERGARSQSQLIEDLLDVSRIISGKLQLKVDPVEMKSVIEAAIQTVRPAAEAKAIELKTFLDPQTEVINGDADRLQQVIWNLLSNAIKFTPVGGEVKISLSNGASNVEIVVSDTGQGIRPEFLPFVFDRFRQADGSITRHFTGLGLGLAIVRHLVELHGGEVSAASAGENQGAVFTVSLPFMTLPEPDQTDDETAEVSAYQDAGDCPMLDGRRILVVDDEADTREILDLIFRNCRASVKVAASAAEALEKVKQWQPHVIVSDIGMPDEDGYSLIRKVRAWEIENDSKQKIKAVALTAYARAEDRAQALDAGFQEHVSKPVEPSELTSLIANLINDSE